MSDYLRETTQMILRGDATNYSQLVFAAGEGVPAQPDDDTGRLRLRLACLALDSKVPLLELLVEIRDALMPVTATPAATGSTPPPMGAVTPPPMGTPASQPVAPPTQGVASPDPVPATGRGRRKR